MSQDFKRAKISPKAEKRMVQVVKTQKPPPPLQKPPRVLPEEVDLEEAAFGPNLKRPKP